MLYPLTCRSTTLKTFPTWTKNGDWLEKLKWINAKADDNSLNCTTYAEQDLNMKIWLLVKINSIIIQVKKASGSVAPHYAYIFSVSVSRLLYFCLLYYTWQMHNKSSFYAHSPSPPHLVGTWGVECGSANNSTVKD